MYYPSMTLEEKFKFSEWLFDVPVIVGLAATAFITYSPAETKWAYWVPAITMGYAALFVVTNVVVSLFIGKTDTSLFFMINRSPQKIVTKGENGSVSFGKIISSKLVVAGVCVALAFYLVLLG